MENQLSTININNLTTLNDTIIQNAITDLESGKVLYLPDYFFTLKKNEEHILSPDLLAPKEKNINFIYQKQRLAGFSKTYPCSSILIQAFMVRFAEFSKQLVTSLFPTYTDSLIWGRTSYRPAAIEHRKTSKLKDDTLLHVDSFPSSPVYGRRILRVFCNINPHGEPRVWHIGEPFDQVLSTFAPNIPSYSPLKARLLKLIRDTKTLRSAYDHYMIKLHNTMKSDDNYQSKVHKYRFEFPSQSTWIVFSDQVSHAALSGQFLLEQTFYLPVSAMQKPDFSPLNQWEKLKSCRLV
jgi:hypothetical protein